VRYHRDVELIVVGGGPAGLEAAIAAAAGGVRSVAIVDHRRRWGEPVRCAELVSRDVGRLLPLPDNCVAGVIESVRWFMDGREQGLVPFPGYVLSRARLEASRAERAAELGVELLQPATATRIRGRTVEVKRDGAAITLRARHVIGADGPRSMVRRAMGIDGALLAPALQATVETSWSPREAWFHFHHDVVPGYAWWIPRDGTAHVGVMVDPAARRRLPQLLRAELRRFASSGSAGGIAVRRTTGGWIPIDGPSPRTAADGMLLCGDAAGQVEPLTGAGIEKALTCGRLAGTAVAGARDPEGAYERSWRAELEARLAESALRRRLLAACDPGRLADAVASAWGFDRV